MVESRHRATVAVVDNAGKVVLRAGDIDRPTYPRSAIKPLQALAIIETGAAERFSVSDTELALASASHVAEPFHTEAVLAWLARIGCTEEDLECGAHWPLDRGTAEALFRAGGHASPVHNNCSGKHAGFLTVAHQLGVDLNGYIGLEHPVQQRVLGILEQMTGLDLGAAPRGIDGCGIPQFGAPLGNLALAMARFADPHDQPDARQAAIHRIQHAMATEPHMVAGTGRFASRVMAAAAPGVLLKGGAEGFYAAALPNLGLGVALKVDDGATRAAEVVMGRVLCRLGAIEAGVVDGLSDLFEPTLFNRNARPVGVVRLAPDGPF